ncbi:MAG: glutamate-cysteine ligase family protein [Bacteroidota bacterium]
MTKKPRLHLFQAYGIELEYMIVDAKTLDVRPIAEVLLKDSSGEIIGEVEKGDVCWSNELVSHVVELKSNGPTKDLPTIRDSFNSNIRAINSLLQEVDAKLMPSAAHPWMLPSKDTVLWPYDSGEIYQIYDKIFGCKGHGWSNLQSTHINLPFYDDEEFAKLHTAIRFVLPIIPAFTASSPILNEKFTGFMDKRLFYYEKNQSKIPAITGMVIPEKVVTMHGYQKQIYDRISKAIKPHDPENMLQPLWLNSRGAIARFDRGSIEIRIVDIQECVSADIAVVFFISHLLKLLISEKWISFSEQLEISTESLHDIFEQTIRNGSQTTIENQEYLKKWRIHQSVSVQDLWAMVIEKVIANYPVESKIWQEPILKMNQATLAERIVSAIDGDFRKERLAEIYGQLSDCLAKDQMFG